MANEKKSPKLFITSLMVAVSNCVLYSKNHESFDDLAKKSFKALNEYMDDKFELLIVDNDLIVNGASVRDAGIHGAGLIKHLKRKGIARLDIINRVTVSEMRQFIADIGEGNRGLNTYPHIQSGMIELDLDDALDDPADFNSKEEVENIRQVFDSVSMDKKLEILQLQSVLTRFMKAFKQEANILKFLSPLKEYSEYTYIHSMNVAVLSIFQAKNLGINPSFHHDIGMAALLHDVGKMFVSKDVLDKKGKLNDAEFTEMKRHPVVGAKFLVKNSNIPKLAAVVAFEHHLHYDGSGYPGSSFQKKGQHICSQIVSIADFFEALRSSRPYRESWDVQKIIALMHKDSGKGFNPLLLDNFIHALKSAIAA
ncbi:HD domain-containing protein [bacterium]|nr:HD domain-containing protein [bacterium]